MLFEGSGMAVNYGPTSPIFADVSDAFFESSTLIVIVLIITKYAG